MPLLRIDAYEGRSRAEVVALLDAVHNTMVSAFGVPERDRYQIYQEHKPEHFLVEDTGLGIARSPRTIVISMTSRPRSDAQKRAFYEGLVAALKPLGLSGEDIMVSVVVNTDADWSFGLGRAQFLTGELT